MDKMNIIDENNGLKYKLVFQSSNESKFGSLIFKIDLFDSTLENRRIGVVQLFSYNIDTLLRVESNPFIFI